MQDHLGTRTLAAWSKYVYLRKTYSLFLFWLFCLFFSLEWKNTQNYPSSIAFLKVIMGKLEATDVAFLLVCVSSPFITAFIRWCSSNDHTMLGTTSSHFHFQPPTLRTKVTGPWVICEHLLLFSYFHGYTKERNNFNMSVRFSWPGKQYTTQHEQSQ